MSALCPACVKALSAEVEDLMTRHTQLYRAARIALHDTKTFSEGTLLLAESTACWERARSILLVLEGV